MQISAKGEGERWRGGVDREKLGKIVKTMRKNCNQTTIDRIKMCWIKM